MAEPSPQRFAERMRLEREKRQWSQHELARQAGVDAAWISRLEKGERVGISLWTAVRIALALGGDLNYLTGLADEIRPSEVWLAEGLQVGRLVPLLACQPQNRSDHEKYSMP